MLIDFRFVEIINDYLNHQENKSLENFSLMFEKLTTLTAFNKMIRFYESLFSENEYREALKSVLLDEVFESDNEMAVMLYTNLLRIKDTHLINRKLELFRHYDFGKLQDNLESTLPYQCDSKLEVYFVYDGINGGSIVGENQMMINFMLWPSNLNYMSAMEGILLHEAHHLGMIEIYTKEGLYQFGKKENDVENSLLISLVTEGIATYLFNQNNSLSDLIVDSHGQEYANLYKESENLKEHKISEMIHKLNQDISLMKASQDYDENAKILGDYCCNYDGGQPLDKAIGVFISKTIDERLGRRRLIELLVNPKEFINTYNALVSKTVQIEF